MEAKIIDYYKKYNLNQKCMESCPNAVLLQQAAKAATNQEGAISRAHGMGIETGNVSCVGSLLHDAVGVTVCRAVVQTSNIPHHPDVSGDITPYLNPDDVSGFEKYRAIQV